MATHLLDERLTHAAERPDSPLLYTDAGVYGPARPVRAYYASGSVADGDVDRGLRMLADHIAVLRKAGPTEAELERVRERLLQRRSQSDAYGEWSGTLAAAIQWHLLEGEALVPPQTDLELARRLLAGIDAKDVRAFMSSWSPDSGVTVIVSSRRSDDVRSRSTADLLALIDTVRAADLAASVMNADTTSLPPLLPTPPSPGRVTEESINRDLTVFDWRLDNGMRVLVKPTRFSENDFDIRLTGPGGASLAAWSDYPSAYMADRVLQAVGIGPLTGPQLDHLLSSTSLIVSPVVDDYAVHLDVEGELPDLQSAFELIHLYFTAPRADSTAFRRYKRRGLAYARARGAEPNAEFDDSLATMLGPLDARHLRSTQPFVSAIALDKALRFWRDRTHNASNFTVVIVGDVTLQRVRPLVQQYLASLPSGHAERLPALASGTQPPIRSFVRGTMQKARTQLTYTDTLTLTPASYHALKSLRDALALALDDRLRERLGGTYDVNVDMSVVPRAKSRYFFSADFEAAPERIDSLAAAAAAEIERLRTRGPSAVELTKIKADRADARERGSLSNSHWAAGLAWHAQLAWPIDSLPRYDADTSLMTRASIAESARRYLTAGALHRLTMRPATAPPQNTPH